LVLSTLCTFRASDKHGQILIFVSLFQLHDGEQNVLIA